MQILEEAGGEYRILEVAVSWTEQEVGRASRLRQEVAPEFWTMQDPGDGEAVTRKVLLCQAGGCLRRGKPDLGV